MEHEMKMELKIDAGFVTVPIIDDKDSGLLGKFKFNPNDLDIVKRYEHVIKEFESITVPENLDPDTLFKISDKIKEQFDYLLNFSVADDIFSVCNPFTLTSDGDFYMEKVLEGVASLIEQTTNQRLNKKAAKIKKATQKYTKGGTKNAVQQFDSPPYRV